MIKIAICEDEMQDKQIIQSYIEEYAIKQKLSYDLRTFESGEQLLERDFIPNILFLDIIMKQKNGIEVGQEIKKKTENIFIIYTTNVPDKVLNAFNQIHSFAYLLKPIDKNIFFNVFEDALGEIRNKNLVHMVTFKTVQKLMANIWVMDIFFFERRGRKTRIVTKNGNEFYIMEKIKDIEEKMKQYGFVLSHKSFVVNMHYVNKIEKMYLVLRDGQKVCLAQKRASTVRDTLMEFVKGIMIEGENKIHLRDKESI